MRRRNITRRKKFLVSYTYNSGNNQYRGRCVITAKSYNPLVREKWATNWIEEKNGVTDVLIIAISEIALNCD